MVGWHHRFNRHEFEQTPGDSKGGGGSLVCCSLRGHRVSYDLGTEQQQQKLTRNLTETEMGMLQRITVYFVFSR